MKVSIYLVFHQRIGTSVSHFKSQRSILVLVGDHGKDQVPNLHQILTKTSVKARPKVLWCYKKELGFSTHRMKRMKKIKRDEARGLAKGATLSDKTADNFELFISTTDINWCYYRDTHRDLGTTVGMLILQDFEALTPNLMARVMETVEDGGLVIFLMRSVTSLKQLYTMTMDVHSRYRTEASGDVVPRFNERFILSLAECNSCLVCDDELNIVPLSKKALVKLGAVEVSKLIKKCDAGDVVKDKTQDECELEDLKNTLRDTPHIGVIVEHARTLDQARAILTFLEACSEMTNRYTVALTAARGRGKSAAIGLSLAGALSLGFSTICVTAPEPENLVAVFEFVIVGLKASKYQEHLDYTITYNANKAGREKIKCIIGIEIHRSHKQSIKYIRPNEIDKFSSAELVAIDEAAAIPLPIVKALMTGGDRLTFMSSTVNGYEGTGRALSLKLLKELRDTKDRNRVVTAANAAAKSLVGPTYNKAAGEIHEKRWAVAAATASSIASFSSKGPNSSGGALREIELATPIRYAENDPVERWLNNLLCLDCGSTSVSDLVGGAPAPSDCELYHVDRDALFSYHKLSEAFLQKLMGLYTSAHYKNTPNDLQMLSDAPAHSLFVLLSPSAEKDSSSLPDILAVVQVALEGRISRKAVEAQLSRGHRSAGDLIPWTICQQFCDPNFAQLSGARIVRVAVHPSVQGMGYGSRAVNLLFHFYNGEMFSLTSNQTNSDEEKDDDSCSDSISDDEASSRGNMKVIQGEKLIPRKDLPPLLLPLTEVKSPQLDWLGTSFGLTTQLHRFWKRLGMHMLYLRQTENELTGEHSSIMIRSLPRKSGYDDAWLPAFLTDSQRRITSLLGGSFCDIDIRLAISILEEFETANIASRRVVQNQVVTDAIGKRSGLSSGKITAAEMFFFLTPHDLKRLELYGRNLCDYHLITDLLPALARLYFLGQLGSDFKLSSVQGALLCGIGLQKKTVDKLTIELELPSNQVLAMFNKGIRKMSIALNNILEDSEKGKSLSSKERLKTEKKAEKLKHVSHQTLEEDVEEGARNTMVTQEM